MRPCPCGSGLTFAQCCEPFLDGAPAPTAEQLMRSRYTAFALGDEDHLFRTWHPRTRPPGPYINPMIDWTGLQVLAVRDGGVDDETGEVDYLAWYVNDDGEGSGEVGERARFSRRARRWVYESGIPLD